MKILILNASPKTAGTISQMLKFLEYEIRRKILSAEIQQLRRMHEVPHRREMHFCWRRRRRCRGKNCARRFSCCGFSVLVGQHDRQPEVSF